MICRALEPQTNIHRGTAKHLCRVSQLYAVKLSIEKIALCIYLMKSYLNKSSNDKFHCCRQITTCVHIRLCSLFRPFSEWKAVFCQFQAVVSSGIHTHTHLIWNSSIHNLWYWIICALFWPNALDTKHFTNVCNQNANGKLFTWQNTEDSLSPCKTHCNKAQNGRIYTQ